jgi:HAD superfamily hydrolase (TIGR01509 family)
MKPEKEIYMIAAKNVNQKLGNCLFMDDRESNVKGAIEAGMQAIQFRDVEKLKADLGQLGII